MNKKLFVSFVFIFLLMISNVNALYYEWGELVQTFGSDVEEQTCGRGVDGGIFLRFHVPSDVTVKFMLPRAYTGGGPIQNQLATLAILMNEPENIKTYTECEEAISAAKAGDDPPTGPYVCVEDDKYDQKSGDIWVEGPTIEEETNEGLVGALPRNTCCPRVPGMTWDGGQLYTTMWPAHSAIVIDSFTAWRGENHYIGGSRLVDTSITAAEQAELIAEIQQEAADSQEDCNQYTDDDAKANCEDRNSQAQAVADANSANVNEIYNELNNDLDAYENTFPEKTLTSINMLSNGREGEGDPYFIVIEFNNNKKKCKDSGCVQSHWNENGGIDATGPEWESGLEGWEGLETLAQTTDPELSGGDNDPGVLEVWSGEWWSRFSGDFFDSFVSAQTVEFLWDWDNYWDTLEDLWDSIVGNPKSVCVFGCHDVTVEVDFFTASLSFNSQVRKEYVSHINDVDPEGSNPYSERTDGFVCDLHMDPEIAQTLDNSDTSSILDDGYKYWCEGSGNYLRSDYRITCSSTTDLSCTVNTGDGTTGGQTPNSNPTQVYNDAHGRTMNNFIDGFTNPTTGWLAGDGYLPIGYRYLISDFDPDYHKDICEASSCLSDWLSESGTEISSSFGKKKTYEGALDSRIPHLRWKTISESTGTLVVLYDGEASCENAALYDVDGNLIETTYGCGDEGIHGYDHYTRFTKKGHEYEMDNIGYIQLGDSKCAIASPAWSSGQDKTRGCYTFDKSLLDQEITENYCCGDDPKDVGKIHVINDVPFACVMDPGGHFEWLSPSKSHSEIPDIRAKGNIYDIFSEEAYEIKTEFNETIDQYVRVYPESYTINYDLLSNGSNWFACQADNPVPNQVGQTIVTVGQSVPVEVDGETHNYICTNEGGAGRFVECYGNNNFNSFDFAINSYIFNNLMWSSYSASHENTFTRIGSFESLPPHYESWSGDIKSNIKHENKRSVRLNSEDTLVTSVNLPLTDWSSYDYLEGVLWYDVSPALKISFSKEGSTMVRDPECISQSLETGVNPNTACDMVPAISDAGTYYLDEYLVNEPKVADWNLFRIPISNLGNVNSLSLSVDDDLYLFDGIDYTFYVDNLNLIGNTSKFCDKNGTTYNWVPDRDNSREACNSFNLGFANTMCCGDDGYEFFSDVTTGCWNSNLIPDNVRFQVVELDINGEYFDFICTDEEPCVYSVPRLSVEPEEYILTNLRNDSYDVHFSISGNITSNRTDDRIVVDVFKWEYVSNFGDFRYCGENEPNLNDLYPNKNEDLGFNYAAIDYANEDVCLLTDNYYCLKSQGWTNKMDNIEARDIENETLPVADCELPSSDLRCIPPNLSERIYVKEMPESNTILNYTYDNYGCCPSDYCWNGVACIEDQANEAFDDPDNKFTTNSEDGFRCIGGEWDFAYRKYTPDGRRHGYCATDDQCFVFKHGVYTENGSLPENGTPQCIGSDYYFGDYYCEDGDWTSRTKFVANLLSEKGGNEYTLFCDSYDVVLNYIGDIGGKQLSEYLNPNNDACLQTFGGVNVNVCANNLCVLNTRNKVAVGTTLNQNINGTNLSFAQLFDNFGLSNEELLTKISQSDSGKLNRLNVVDGIHWYYEPSLNAVFFSEYNLRNSFFEAVAEFISDSFTDLKNWLTGTEPESEILFDLDGFDSIADLRFIRNANQYSDIYLAESPSLNVKAIHNNQYNYYTENNVNYVAVDYEGANRNFCDYITNFDYIENPEQNEIVCTQTRGSHKVFAKGKLNVWEDLTSKLRILE